MWAKGRFLQQMNFGGENIEEGEEGVRESLGGTYLLQVGSGPTVLVYFLKEMLMSIICLSCLSLKTLSFRWEPRFLLQGRTGLVDGAPSTSGRK